MTQASELAATQYLSASDKLAARIALLDYDSCEKGWYGWLGDQIAPEGDVLEVGGGTGQLWRHIDHSKAQLTLTDFSSAMCQHLRDLKIPGARIEQCDAISLPFPDACFDLVIANNMLYHLDDPDAALKEFSRVLRPGGRLKTSLNHRTHIQELLDLGAMIGQPSPFLDKLHVTAETAPQFLSKRFVDVTSARAPGAFIVPDATPVLRYLSSYKDEPLSAEQIASVRKVVDEDIRKNGTFTIRKELTLFSSRRS